MTRDEFVQRFCRGIPTSRFAVPAGFRGYNLQKIRSLRGITFGPDVQLHGLQDPCDFGTPALLPAEIPIIQGINVKKFRTRDWPVYDPTMLCLMQWAVKLSGQKGDPEEVACRVLPSLAHLFYTSVADESLKQMIRRLQQKYDLPKTPRTVK